MDMMRTKREVGRWALPAVLAATVGVVAYFPRSEQIEAARDRVAAWWGGPDLPGPIDPDPPPPIRRHLPAPTRDRDRE